MELFYHAFEINQYLELPANFDISKSFVVTIHTVSGQVYRYPFITLPAQGENRKLPAFYLHVCSGLHDTGIPLRPRIYLNGLHEETLPDTANKNEL